MPIIKIDIASLTKEQKVSLIEKLTMVSAEITKIPQYAFTVIINELGDDNIGVGGKTLEEVKKARNS
ncbi:MAG TPA: 4-oxalocrotonate tautomerase DmpI [Nitrospirota bacterium]|nr:4-oxalocrotonate tautomerase DmpI [Nitrospirota bacterium]